ncbi:hypothetical protein [Ruficoccus sp. ZRK36]|uniref:hypothetical protein n=1 Tax=Ruficoccus sp. ZRK36 TaxID=2866311 RepID=UPI001C72C5C1|nr:hypothetical protein [Ruficoccus sp. ZRK36]QYY37448.1 hypothetical protein K0V07_08160 [Ruficoccus sp. ZRK36]
MAITLEANYSKKLGLPQYSSHQYSITVRTEVNDLAHIQQASTHLYRQLQDAVDRDIQETGFLPVSGSSLHEPARTPLRADPNRPDFNRQASTGWACSPKQQALIERMMKEHGITTDALEELSQSRFQTPLTRLNKMQASGLIDELIGTYGSAKGRNRS